MLVILRHYSTQILETSMRRSSAHYQLLILILLALVTGSVCGCRMFSTTAYSGSPQVEVPNPLTVPAYDRTLVMDQVSDELDDYFRIYKEEQIRIVDNVMTEGWIETHPQIGGTIFEPWRKDSTRGFERLHSTLQTVRRFAKVRVIPTGNSYLVDVKVYKELEDKQFPQYSTFSGRQLRHDNSLDIDRNEIDIVETEGWIPLGRDFSLEQRILRNIQSRISENCGPQ